MDGRRMCALAPSPTSEPVPRDIPVQTMLPVSTSVQAYAADCQPLQQWIDKSAVKIRTRDKIFSKVNVQEPIIQKPKRKRQKISNYSSFRLKAAF